MFDYALAEVIVGTSASTIVATAVNAEPLVTAIIALLTSLVTMVGGELIKFLVTFFKKKTRDLDYKEDEDDKKKEDKE